MRGRCVGVQVSSTSVEVAKKNPNRTSIVFFVGDASNASSVILKDQIDATAANGVPLQSGGGELRLEGEIAGHQWFAIRLKATDCVVGVIEGFPEGYAEGVADADAVGVETIVS